MEALLEDYISPDDLKGFECNYHESRKNGTLTSQTQFEYAWCLIRSKYRADINRGIVLLEELCHSQAGEEKRDYLFYLAIANTKIADYSRALDCIDKFLLAEPSNRQASELKKIIKDRIKRDGLKGAAIAGGAALVVGGLVGLVGMALARK
ncbi:mitochondrial fission 1 protein-like [Panonychus citri]|uniref:mitochondrial fission 1 protein-like n=1 Tax=Panonychus citri TaxID=50023 RepID=UPI0023075FFA|nr:mitochondrial fission 1 protein-like [Panonychus citri]XP_053200910.1 mitochondrial fission 1 protein-like [Panonychus citri]